MAGAAGAASELTLHETGELEAIAKATAKNENQGKFWIKKGGKRIS